MSVEATTNARAYPIVVAVLVGVALLAGTILALRSGVRDTLVMATGPAGSTYAQYGEQYRRLLARNGIDLQLRPTGGTVENLRLLNDPTAGVDVAFLSAGTTTADRAPDLRTLGAVFLEELWLFTRNLDVSRSDLTVLRGQRVSIGPEGSATRSMVQTMFQLNRFDSSAADLVGLAPQLAAEQLRRGQLDAAFIMTSADSPVVRGLLADPAIDLVGFRRAAAYVALHPFLTELTVPEGIGDLAANRPPMDVKTVGAAVSLAVRADMHSALQALLLKAASQIHAAAGMFNAAGRFPAEQAIDLPLSDAALQYYKSGVPFLQKYLPFGIAVLVGQLLLGVVPIVGVLYPALRLAPGVYDWAMRQRIFRLYGELKLLEHELDADPGTERKAALRTQLDALERRVGHMRISNAYAQVIYTLRLHINLVRSRL
jgi:TRAP-type uncharacterized transport system substrate-binding protein